MGPAFYVMAILGCGEADVACEPVGVAPARYESAAECNAATEDAIAAHGDALYPVIVAQCRPASAPAAQQIWADEVRLPNADENGQPRLRQAAARKGAARS